MSALDTVILAGKTVFAGAGAPERFLAVTLRVPDHAHIRIEGLCSPEVTVEDIQRKFYDPYFGGRDAWVGEVEEERGVKFRRFRVIEHTD